MMVAVKVIGPPSPTGRLAPPAERSYQQSSSLARPPARLHAQEPTPPFTSPVSRRSRPARPLRSNPTKR